MFEKNLRNVGIEAGSAVPKSFLAAPVIEVSDEPKAHFG